ncbi:unnamed protein product [Gongylonema pulchrum]|uniref:ZP domain-containing protein n=1 Tax=Gongylonema pulchrum TaxID=637853 RepID=A0A183CW35_9BILA|nr:unnamed protein product [Gongylonema pulchrum]
MVVHSCNVDDGNGDVVTILDTNGCALDKYILNNLEYPGDLTAGQEAHVYKYADRSQLFYQCQITITAKERNETCPRPQCREPVGRGAGSGNTPSAADGGTVSSLGVVSFASGKEPEELSVNVSSPTAVELNVTKNARPSAHRRDFLRRHKKDVDWRRNSIGTVDVRAEMNALDVPQQVFRLLHSSV